MNIDIEIYYKPFFKIERMLSIITGDVKVIVRFQSFQVNNSIHYDHFILCLAIKKSYNQKALLKKKRFRTGRVLEYDKPHF